MAGRASAAGLSEFGMVYLRSMGEMSWVLVSCLGVGLWLFYGCEGRLRRPIVALMRTCLIILSFLGVFVLRTT